MLKSKRFIVSVLVIGVYLLSACSAANVASKSADDSQNGQPQEVVTAESVDSNENSNSNSNDANANDDNVNANDNSNNSNDNSNSNTNANDNGAPAGQEQETFGIVEAITSDTITINGIVYSLANFTEFKDVVIVGDQVKIHVIVNADGTLAIVEIEKSTGAGIGDDNSNDDNSNLNGNDNSNDDNSNDNSSNDNGDDNSNGGGDDDNSNSGGDDNNSNSNDND